MLDNVVTETKFVGTRLHNGVQERVVSRRLAWTNGSTRSEGTLVTAIDPTGQPSEALFHGRCGTAPCVFQQTFESRPIAVTLP